MTPAKRRGEFEIIAELFAPLSKGEPGAFALTPPAAALKPNQLQDLVDVLPDLIKTAAGHDLTFRLAVEIKGKERPGDKLIAAVNKLFKDLDDELQIQ